MKSIPIALLAVLIAGLYWMMSGEMTGTAEALTPEPAVQQPDFVEQTDLPAAAELTSFATERSVVETGQEPVTAQETAQPPLPGQVILSEPSGIQLKNLNGTLEVQCWSPDGNHKQIVEVRSGQFELDVTDLESIAIQEIVLGGQFAMLSSPEQEFELDQDALQVFVMWAPRVRLSVISAESSEHLSGIQLVHKRGWMSESKMHPGRISKASVALSNGISPLDLQADTSQATSASTTYHVHSPGYAWQPVSINYASGGEREVRLTRGGDLSIQLIGDLPRRGAYLCLVALPSTSNEPDATFPATTRGPVEIEDLLPGGYRLHVQHGKWYDNPLVYAKLDVEVIAGVRGEYELVLEAKKEAPVVLLAGTLVVPEAWNFTTFTLRAKFDGTTPNGGTSAASLQQHDMAQATGDSDTWLFNFGEMTTGSYEFVFQGVPPDGDKGRPRAMGYAFKVQALPGGASNVRLEVPEPANVSVELLDAQSGESTGLPSIHWGSLIPPITWAKVLNTVRCEVTGSSFKFRAPVGTIHLGSFGGDFTSLGENVQIHAGNNEFVFHLRRNCPLVILFFDGESAVPVVDFGHPRPEHLDGDGQLLFTRGGQTGFTTALSEPGRYVFPIPEFDGFEPIPDQTITVVSGEKTTHRVQLVRKK